MPGDHLDLSSQPEFGPRPPGCQITRPFLGVHYQCCSVYARVYLNREGTAYVGHCPRCSRQVRFRVGPGGSDARFFQA